MRLSAPLDRLGRRLLQAWEERAIALKAASFAAIGVVNTLVDFGTFLMARELFRSPYFISALGRAAEFCDCSTAEKLALIPANVVAWSVAVSGSYILNTFVTFAVESGRRLSLKAFASFAVSGIAGLIANTATVYALSYLVSEVVAKICAILASFLVNFSLSHFVVFRTREPRAPRSAE